MCPLCSAETIDINESNYLCLDESLSVFDDRAHDNKTFVELSFSSFDEWLSFYCGFKTNNNERFFLPKDSEYQITYFFGGYIEKGLELDDYSSLVFDSPVAAVSFNLRNGDKDSFTVMPWTKDIGRLEATPIFLYGAPTIIVTSDNFLAGVVWASDGTDYKRLTSHSKSILDCYKQGAAYVF